MVEASGGSARPFDEATGQMERLAAVEYKYDVSCPECKKTLAERGQMSAVVDARGEVMNVSSTGSDKAHSFYALDCGKCGKTIALESPVNVLDYSVFELGDCTAPPIRDKW